MLDISINDTLIPQVHHSKFLGVIIDNELTWVKHINELWDKLHANKFLLQLGKNFLDHASLKAVYNAHINSHLNYGNVVWSSMLTKAQMDDLFKIQKACMRILHKKPQHSISEPLFWKSGILTIKQLVELELLKFGYKITNNLAPFPIRSLMHKNKGKKLHGYNTWSKTYLMCKSIKVSTSTKAS